MPYIDDNSPRQNSPLRISIALAARYVEAFRATWRRVHMFKDLLKTKPESRVCGPTLGTLLGAACLRVYVNLGEDPGFDEGHPSWVGAWWLGPLLLSAMTITVGPWLILFPGRLKVEKSDGEDMHNDDPEPDNIKEYVKGFLRCVDIYEPEMSI